MSSRVIIPEGEIEICRYISSRLGHYYCFWYEDLNNAFFQGRGYGDQTIADAQHNLNSLASKLLQALVVLLRDAPQFGIVTVSDIACCCRALGVPALHVIYWSEQLYDGIHPLPPVPSESPMAAASYDNLVKFTQLVCRQHPTQQQPGTGGGGGGVVQQQKEGSSSKQDPYVIEFNLLKAQYEGNAELYLHYATVLRALKQQQKAGNFVCQTYRVEFKGAEIETRLKEVLMAPCMTPLFTQDVKIHKSYQQYKAGFIESTNRTKLGNFLAVYNRYLVLIGLAERCCVEFEYNFTPVALIVTSSGRREGSNRNRPGSSSSRRYQPQQVEDIVRSMVTQPIVRCDKYLGLPPSAHHLPKYTLKDYQHLVQKHLNINFDLDNKKEGVFSIYTGIVVHANLMIKGSIRTEKIINKPLVRYICKQRTMTCSYYKEVNDFSWVKFNFNCQGEEFFIRGKLLVVYAKIRDVCDFSRSNDKLVISNQCGHIRGLNSGVINVHSYRTRMLYNEVNCFKVPSFPAIKLVDETQTNQSRDNLIHREAVLARIHKSHSMLDNITMIKNKMYPHCERIQEIHDLVYAVESRLRLVLIGPLLGILKMYYLYYSNNSSNDESATASIIRTFVHRLWIDQYVIAQNGSNGRAPMCHRIKDTTAIKCTSIKTVKCAAKQQPQPPIVDDPQLLTLVADLFEDVAVGALTPRLWKGRGAFSYLNVLIQAPTKTVYGETGRQFVQALYQMIDKHGGRDQFPDSYKLLDIYQKFQQERQ